MSKPPSTATSSNFIARDILSINAMNYEKVKILSMTSVENFIRSYITIILIFCPVTGKNTSLIKLFADYTNLQFVLSATSFKNATRFSLIALFYDVPLNDIISNHLN